MDTIKKIHDYISADISQMNSLIMDSLEVDEELIGLVSNHLANSGGKRIRPILTILCAKMLSDEDHHNSIKLATAVEFIHMATLLHDDVVDGSKMRRFMPAAHTIWGSEASILVGDFLFSRAFTLMVSTSIMPALEVLSNASTTIARGEVKQLAHAKTKQIISKKEYFEIIDAKTAELFGASCEVAAYITGKHEYAHNLKKFGSNLGVIFQISDDILDYFVDAEKSGKNIGDDFFEGKITLPVILLHQKCTQDESSQIENIFKEDKRSSKQLEWIIDRMKFYNIADIINDILLEKRKDTDMYLGKINQNEKIYSYLQQLTEFVINRTY